LIGKTVGLTIREQLDQLHDQRGQQFDLVRAELGDDHAPPLVEFFHI
jgi:hypothetical protein